MLNKNDPLVGAIQDIMSKNQAERDAVKAVNEKFGVQDRRVLPREKQGEWDAAYQSVLTEGIESLDEKIKMSKKQFANLDGKPGFTKNDLAHARAKIHVKKAAAGALEEDDTTSPSSMGIKKPDYAPAGTTPDYANKGPQTQTPNRAAKSSLPAGTMKEEEQIDEKAPSGAKYERMVKHIKNKMSKGGLTKKEKSIAYATTWKAKKKSDVNEGFNNRHDSSVTASAEKQIVAEQPMGGSAPGIALRNRIAQSGKSQRFRPAGSPVRPVKVDARNNVPVSQKPGINASTGSLSATDTQRRAGYSLTDVRDTAYGANPTDKKLGPASSTGGAGPSPVPVPNRAAPKPTMTSRVATRPDVPVGSLSAARKPSTVPASTSARDPKSSNALSARMRQTAGQRQGATAPPKPSIAADNPVVSKTTTNPVEPKTFKDAFAAARKAAAEKGSTSTGTFKFKGKEYQTNTKGEKYVAASKQTDVTPKPTTTTSVTGGQGISGIASNSTNKPIVKPAVDAKAQGFAPAGIASRPATGVGPQQAPKPAAPTPDAMSNLGRVSQRTSGPSTSLDSPSPRATSQQTSDIVKNISRANSGLPLPPRNKI
jgi:hypothetical protein